MKRSRPLLRACILLLLVGVLASCEEPTSGIARATGEGGRRDNNQMPEVGGEGRLFSNGGRNPVLDADFPDPTVIRTSEGPFFAYATQVIRAPGTVNIQVASSEDLLTWTYRGEALPNKPSWAKTTQDFWAPHVTERDGTFYLYYSAVPDDEVGNDIYCLAAATSDRPEGPFTDLGEPFLCSGGVDIDPVTLRDPRTGAWFMYWAASGDIVGQRLDDDMTSLRGDGPTFLLAGYSAARSRPYEDIVEGPFVVRRAGWFYLFYSGDRCCEYPGHYAVLVARSRRPLGPFKRLGRATGRRSSVILSQNERWNAPGHGSLVRDAAGRDWFVYHAIDSRDPYLAAGGVRRPMLLDRVTYEHGWPRIGAGKPSRRPARSTP